MLLLREASHKVVHHSPYGSIDGTQVLKLNLYKSVPFSGSVHSHWTRTVDKHRHTARNIHHNMPFLQFDSQTIHAPARVDEQELLTQSVFYRRRSQGCYPVRAQPGLCGWGRRYHQHLSTESVQAIRGFPYQKNGARLGGWR